MATLAVNEISVAGWAVSLAAAAGGGDDFANDGRTFLVVDNGGGGAITVTVDDTLSQSPPSAKQFDPDVDITVNAAERKYIGPFGTSRFGSSVAVTYSGVASVTVAAVRVPAVK